MHDDEHDVEHERDRPRVERAAVAAWHGVDCALVLAHEVVDGWGVWLGVIQRVSLRVVTCDSRGDERDWEASSVLGVVTLSRSRGRKVHKHSPWMMMGTSVTPRKAVIIK